MQLSAYEQMCLDRANDKRAATGGKKINRDTYFAELIRLGLTSYEVASDEPAVAQTCAPAALELPDPYATQRALINQAIASGQNSLAVDLLKLSR